jgi:predicted negative regulator of RcsB-dependent stress response
MKNFIEVGTTEEEQVEQVKKWLKENGLQIIIGIALGLGGIWGFNAYETYQHQQNLKARTLYLKLKANPEPALYTTFKNEHSDSGYTQEAALLMAKNSIAQKDYVAATKYLKPLTQSKHSIIANIAKLRLANVQLTLKEFDEALSTLDTISIAFEAIANQLKGDIYLTNNQINLAKEHYTLALSQAKPRSGLKNIIQIQLDDLN